MASEVEGLSGLPSAARIKVVWATTHRCHPARVSLRPLYPMLGGWSFDGEHLVTEPVVEFSGTSVAFGEAGVLVIGEGGRLAIMPPEQLRAVE